MHKSFILLSLLLLTFVYNKKESNTKLKQWTPIDIVQLIKNSKIQKYGLIDPDDYIKQDEEIILEKEIKDIYTNHKVHTFIIFVKNIYPNSSDNDKKNVNITKFTEEVVNEIVKQKIIPEKNNLLVAVISADDQVMTMRTYGKVSYTITEEDCYTILNTLNRYYSYGEYSYGTLQLGKVIKYYLENTGFMSRNSRFFIMLIALIFSFLLCYCCAKIAQTIRDRRNLRLTMSDEEKLIKIKDFLKRCKGDKKILSENCIICLEPFDNCVSVNNSLVDDENVNTHQQCEGEQNNDENINVNEVQRQSNMTDNQISTLPCGHRYHVRCITEWMLKRHNICPMCREKMDVGIPDESIIEDDLQNELLNIQIDLHPAFALLVFQTINEELTWGAMALPALGSGWLAGFGGLAFV